MAKYAVIISKSELAKKADKISEFSKEQRDELKVVEGFDEAVKVFLSEAKDLFNDTYNYAMDSLFRDLEDGYFITDEETEINLIKTCDIMADLVLNQIVPSEGVANTYASADYDGEGWSVDISNNVLLYKAYRDELGHNRVLYTNVLKMDDPSKEYFMIETNMFAGDRDYDDDPAENGYASLKIVPID